METYYDYDKQAWVKNGRYVSCNHPKEMDCTCYGKVNAGKEAIKNSNCILVRGEHE